MYKLIVLDVDGTLTDGKIYMSSEGEMFKSFDVKDGYGIKHILPQLEMKAVIITGRKSKIVSKRAEELDIEYVFQGVSDKLECLNRLIDKLGINLGEVVYIGDDINDIECMKVVGYKCCPADAHIKVKEIVDYIANNTGGKGAVREIIDKLYGETQNIK